MRGFISTGNCNATFRRATASLSGARSIPSSSSTLRVTATSRCCGRSCTGAKCSSCRMLQHLSIRDFAIVDRLELEFRPGFTALTGETGAGKSILIDALSLTLGDRAGSEQVRSGAERADVTAEFAIDSLPGIGEWLRAHALEGDPNRLLLRRVVDANGRSRAFINGHTATINQMREAGDRLGHSHGPQAHQVPLPPAGPRLGLDAPARLTPV